MSNNQILVADASSSTIDLTHSILIIINLLEDTRQSFFESLQDFQHNADLESEREFNPNGIYRITPPDLIDLKESLACLARKISILEVSVGIILHFDAHGVDSDNPILSFNDGAEHVPLSAIQPELSLIYHATEGRLTLCASVCYGARYLNLVKNAIRNKNVSPFSCLIAPGKEVTDREADSFWKCFYRNLYEKKDPMKCLEDSGFGLFPIGEFVLQAIKHSKSNSSLKSMREDIAKRSYLDSTRKCNSQGLI